MFIIKGTSLEASFYGFYKDKHRKFCVIMTKFSLIWAILRYVGYFESLLHLSESKNFFSVWNMSLGLRNP